MKSNEFINEGWLDSLSDMISGPGRERKVEQLAHGPIDVWVKYQLPKLKKDGLITDVNSYRAEFSKYLGKAFRLKAVNVMPLTAPISSTSPDNPTLLAIVRDCQSRSPRLT